MEVFFPYLSMRAEFGNDRARRRLARADIETVAVESYLDRLLRFAERAGWGRESITREEARRIEQS
jgi:hypothetical protein